jgi:hypothetical protein
MGNKIWEMSKGDYTIKIHKVESEYKVGLYNNKSVKSNYAETNYYTNDRQDAIDTAKLMLKDITITPDPRQLTQGSINTIYKYSGQLDLILQHIRQMQSFCNNEKIGADDRRDHVLGEALDIVELIDNNPQLLNDLGFIKDIYNRKHYLFESGQLTIDQL